MWCLGTGRLLCGIGIMRLSAATSLARCFLRFRTYCRRLGAHPAITCFNKDKLRLAPGRAPELACKAADAILVIKWLRVELCEQDFALKLTFGKRLNPPIRRMVLECDLLFQNYYWRIK